MSSAGSGFIRTLSQAFNPDVSEFTEAYIDYLLVASQTFDEHISHLSRLFRRLRDSQFTLNLGKTLFFRKSVPFLGFILTTGGGGGGDQS